MYVLLADATRKNTNTSNELVNGVPMQPTTK